MTTEHATELELMVDRYSVAEVLEALASICREKADHIRTNWQDNATAKEWDKRANALEKVHDRIA